MYVECTHVLSTAPGACVAWEGGTFIHKAKSPKMKCQYFQLVILKNFELQEESCSSTLPSL